MVRLVKGAYWDAEIKWAQIEGLSGYPVYTARPIPMSPTLPAPGACWPPASGHCRSLRPQRPDGRGGPGDGSRRRRRGLRIPVPVRHGAGLFRHLLRTRAIARPVRVYAPVGSRATLLAYLMRRLIENGAAGSFVHRAASAATPIDVLCADPAETASRHAARPHPRIPVPRDLFAPERCNSVGVDLADAAARAH